MNDRGLYGDGLAGLERRLSERIERLEKAAVLTEKVLSAVLGIPPAPAPSASPTGQSGVPLKAEERCKCGHPRKNHSFYEDHDECGLCEMCDRFLHVPLPPAAAVSPPPAGEAGKREHRYTYSDGRWSKWFACVGPACYYLSEPLRTAEHRPAPDPSAREQERPPASMVAAEDNEGHGESCWCNDCYARRFASPAPDAQQRDAAADLVPSQGREQRRTWTLHVWPDHPLPDVCMMEGGTCGVEKLGATLVTVVEQREGERLVPDTGERVREGLVGHGWLACREAGEHSYLHTAHRTIIVLPAPDSSEASNAETKEKA